MALAPERVRAYCKKEIRILRKETATVDRHAAGDAQHGESGTGAPADGPAVPRQRVGPFPRAFASMIDSNLDEHHYSMAVTLLECTMSEQWYPQWYLVGPLLYLRPSAANNVDFETVLLAFLAVRNVATCHPPRTVFRDPAELSRAEAEEDGSRACLANTLRIWDIVDEVISMLREKPNQPTPVKPRVRRRKRASSDNSSDDDLPIPKPRDYFAERPKEAELTDEIRRELARCILQTLVFILQRDIVTQEADVRETFLYRSFKQVENISRRAGAALSELLRLGAGDDESPQTLKLALEFVGLIGLVSDLAPIRDFPDLLSRELTSCDTEFLELIFDMMPSPSLRLRITRDIVLSEFSLPRSPDMLCPASDFVRTFLLASPTKKRLRDGAQWRRLARLLSDMARGIMVLYGPEPPEDAVRAMRDELPRAAAAMRRRMEAEADTGKARRSLRRPASDTSGTEAEDAEAEAYVDFLGGMWQVLMEPWESDEGEDGEQGREPREEMHVQGEEEV